ncbi:MAG: DIP1984 family protein [Candidatus Micrarchaeota archaeon]|nr:DIP1984 family protein [Candidatus Micrarchaeota archaeon]
MKLAEGLILRADLNKRMYQIKERLMRNAKVQEGDKPAEEPKELLKELDKVLTELTQLIQRINRTNVSTKLGTDITIADAITERDILKIKHSIYMDLANAASITLDRFTKSEIKFVNTVNSADLHKKADDLAKRYRELDTKIQEANWLTELIE